MKYRKLISAVAAILATATVFLVARVRPQSSTAAVRPRNNVQVLLSQALPQLDGKHLAVREVEVNYAPGGASAVHSHPCPVIAYVAEGAIESQVKGQPLRTYPAGTTFYEPPNGVHAVSRNASQTEPARLIAFFVCDHPAPLVIPAHATQTPDGKE